MENCIGINKIGSMLRAPGCPLHVVRRDEKAGQAPGA